MTFSIITPSFNQLDWLRLCVASVRDQTAASSGIVNSSLPIVNSSQESAISNQQLPSGQSICSGFGEAKTTGVSIRNQQPTIPTLRVEHIIQDAGTPGIEEFAREVGADFYRDGKLVFQSERGKQDSGVGMRNAESSESSDHSKSNIQHPKSRYRIAVFCECDSGMYDAINRGLLRATGEICAYLNCDEQYLPGTLGRVRGFFEASGKTDVLLGAAIVVRPDGSYHCDRRVSVPKRLHTLVSGNLSIFTSSTFFRKISVVDRGLLFDPSWRVAGDGVWVLSLISAKLRMTAIAEPLASFVFSGDNLSFQKSASSETARLFKMAPVYARIGKPVILAAYRLRRLLSGNYSLPPHSYEIYTRESSGKRVAFSVEHPTFRWRIS